MLAAFPHAMPLEGLIGGLMIGVAAALMLLGLGRIAGVSGLAARATGIADSGAPRGIATAFVIGLPLGAYILSAIIGGVETRFPPSIIPLLIGGCGMSRLSPRSLIATAIFMASGFVTVALMRAGGLL